MEKLKNHWLSILQENEDIAYFRAKLFKPLKFPFEVKLEERNVGTNLLTDDKPVVVDFYANWCPHVE